MSPLHFVSVGLKSTSPDARSLPFHALDVHHSDCSSSMGPQVRWTDRRTPHSPVVLGKSMLTILGRTRSFPVAAFRVKLSPREDEPEAVESAGLEQTSTVTGQRRRILRTLHIDR